MNSPVPDPIYRTMGERIKAVRSAWGWSQEEMASALRVDQASISFWERDRIVPSGSAMVALAALIRTSPEALENGKGFVVPEPPAKAASRREGRKPLRSLALPVGDSEQPVVVDLKDGSARGQAIPDATSRLADALKQGRRAWIVIE